MSKIIYLGYYEGSNKKRKVSPAGNTLMEYIIDIFAKKKKKIIVISTAQANISLDKEIVDDFNKKIIYLPSYKKNKIYLKIISILEEKRNLYNELMNTVEDGDILIVYHSLAYINILKKIRKKKNFRLILQVCEIYADILENDRIRNKEIKWISSADDYIFSSDLLRDILNNDNKSNVILYGTYKVELERGKKFADNKIHVVYAGTFDIRKGGAAAAESAQFLSSEYCIHILGFGNEQEIDEMEKLTRNISEISQCEVIFEGLKMGEEYIRFIQACDIGLSTQSPDARFNSTSFPSKILSYMANGLRVASIDIPAINKSEIGKYLYYYENQTPKDIALVIQNIDLNKTYDSRNIIKNMDIQFIENLFNLLENENAEK